MKRELGRDFARGSSGNPSGLGGGGGGGLMEHAPHITSMGSPSYPCMNLLHHNTNRSHQQQQQTPSYETLEEKAEKNRERNREHAKRTRLRKKEFIENMKMRLLELQREAIRLEQLLEESNTANILLCLGNKDSGSSNMENLVLSAGGASPQEIEEIKIAKSLVPKGNIIDQLRQKVRLEAAKTLKNSFLGGGGGAEHTTTCSSSSPSVKSDSNNHETETNTTTESGSAVDEENSSLHSGNFHIHSTSFHIRKQYDEEDFDEEEEEDDDEEQHDKHSSSSPVDPESQKRERNRMHAKLTRDRKKLFTTKMQQTIQTLERHNQLMRMQLERIMRGSTVHIPYAISEPTAVSTPVPVMNHHHQQQQQQQHHSAIPSHAIYRMDTHANIMQAAFPNPALYGMEGYTALWPITPFSLSSLAVAAGYQQQQQPTMESQIEVAGPARKRVKHEK